MGLRGSELGREPAWVEEAIFAGDAHPESAGQMTARGWKLTEVPSAAEQRSNHLSKNGNPSLAGTQPERNSARRAVAIAQMRFELEKGSGPEQEVGSTKHEAARRSLKQRNSAVGSLHARARAVSREQRQRHARKSRIGEGKTL